LKRFFYTKKQWKKVNKDSKKLETMKKIKNSEENKKFLHFFLLFFVVFKNSEENK
jgi:ATP/ADP translocase